LLRLSANHEIRRVPTLRSGFGRLPLSALDGRCVQGPGTYSRRRSWSAVTSDSGFMRAGCSPQSELGLLLRDLLHLAT